MTLPTMPKVNLRSFASGAAVVAGVFALLWLVDHNDWFQQSAQAQGPPPYAECERLRHHGDPGARACYQRLAQSRDAWTRAEGLWGLKDWEGANTAFQQAIKDNEKDPLRRVRWGLLFNDHYGPSEAQALFSEALELDENYAPALLGMAMVGADNFQGDAIKFAEAALKGDPKLYQAMEVVAKIQLEDNNPEKARAAAEAALKISPEALDALSILAIADWLEDKPGTEHIDRLNKVNPRYAKLHATAGHFFVINRRYDEGIEQYRKALEIEPDLWSARAELGVNLMRFGKDAEAYENLQACYNGGWKSALVTNSLTLMDSYKNFEFTESPSTILKVHKKEAELVRPYIQSELDRAMATYEKKYKHKLDGPVQLEVYPDHADFEVRTMGVPGLGALGVTFGKVVAMDSPSSRTPGEFHWASTLWHELSHVFVLSMTKSRTPRWFTEGVAVYEETATEPHWGDRMTPREIQAIKEDKLLPIAELDRGYIHPTYPEQVIVSYYQGGQVITFIVEKWGYDAVLGMIHAFAEKKDTATVVQEVLKVSPEDFDKQFFPWLKARTEKTVSGFDDWLKRYKTVAEAAQKKDWDKVIAEGNAIRDIYPEYVEKGSPYELLASAYVAKGDKASAIAQLEKYAQVGGKTPATLMQLADLQTEAGNKRAAAAAIEKLNMIYLTYNDQHMKLGALYTDLKDDKGILREYRAAVAAGPSDPAEAHYRLALALKNAGQKDEAMEHVLAALETAPSFRPAQRLLLELDPQ